VPGVLVHVHSLPGGKIFSSVFHWYRNILDSSGVGWCTPFIGISPTNNIMVQVHSNSSSSIIQGPVIQTYSPTNGQCLYVNCAVCYNPGILLNPYQSMIDELRIYSRELSSIDVCLLAWP
jgi:hypothetical protein